MAGVTASLLTPVARGAIASVGVAGPGSVELVGRLFRPASGRPLESCPVGRIVFGHWASGEELVVCRREENLVEVHCHGGQAAPAAVLDSLAAAGAKIIDWPAWIRMREHDSIAADALVALADARTYRTATILLDQYHGALRQALEAVRHDLHAGQTELATEKVRRLLSHADVGRHLTSPYRVVLTGRPNVGKSSLINALVGYRRAIVNETPGTTRDLVTAQAVLDGWPVELTDTAGIRQSEDELEAAGVELARRRFGSADLVIVLFDGSLPWTTEDQELREALPNALAVLSKCDLARRLPGDVTGLSVSTVTGEGLRELEAETTRRLVPNPPAPGAAVPFNERHLAVLSDVLMLLQANDTSTARDEIAQLLA